jgi:ketosteroid isomerase-like protein
MKVLTTLSVIGMFLTTAAMADDVDDVKAAELDLLAAENAGDMDRLYRHVDPERTIFLPSGGLLAVAGGEKDKRRRQASFEAGLKFDLQVRHR